MVSFCTATRKKKHKLELAFKPGSPRPLRGLRWGVTPPERVVDPPLGCRERKAPLPPAHLRAGVQHGRSCGQELYQSYGAKYGRLFAAASAGTDADRPSSAPGDFTHGFRRRVSLLALPSGIRVGVAAVCAGRSRSRNGADGSKAGRHISCYFGSRETDPNCPGRSSESLTHCDSINLL